MASFSRPVFGGLLPALMLLYGSNSSSQEVRVQPSDGPTSIENTGWALITVNGFGRPSIASYSGQLSLRSISSGLHSEIPFSFRKLLTSRDQGADNSSPLTQAEPAGSLIVLELPKGKYLFSGYRVSSSVPGASPIASTSVWNYAFEIDPGKVNYIGSMNFREVLSNANAGARMFVRVTDDHVRDLRLFRERYDSFRSIPSKQICDSCKLTTPDEPSQDEAAASNPLPEPPKAQAPDDPWQAAYRRCISNTKGPDCIVKDLNACVIAFRSSHDTDTYSKCLEAVGRTH